MAAIAAPLIASGIGALGSWLAGRNKNNNSVDPAVIAQLQQLFGQTTGSANDQQHIADALQQLYTQYLQQSAQDGFGDTGFIRGTGESILPNARGAQDNARARQEFLQRLNQGLTSAGVTTGKIQSAIDQFGEGINATGNTVGTEINDTFGRGMGRSEDTSRGVVGSIGDTFGGAIDATSGLYGSLRGDSVGTFSGVRGNAGAAYDETGKLIDTLDPSGQEASARAARSFEPVMASTALRLRKAGVDPGSPEFDAAMREIESQRARAMDDAAIGSNETFVREKNANTLGRASTQRDLDLAGLQNRQGLSVREGDINRDLGLQQGDALRTEMIRNLVTQNGMDISRAQAIVANLNLTQDRAADYWREMFKLPLTQSQLEQAEYGRQTDLANRGDATDARVNQIDENVFNTGMNWRAQQLGYTNEQWARLGAAGQQAAINAGNLRQQGVQALQAGNQVAGSQPPQSSGIGGFLAGAAPAIGGAVGNWLTTPRAPTSWSPNVQSQTNSTGNSSMTYQFPTGVGRGPDDGGGYGTSSAGTRPTSTRFGMAQVQPPQVQNVPTVAPNTAPPRVGGGIPQSRMPTFDYPMPPPQFGMQVRQPSYVNNRVR